MLTLPKGQTLIVTGLTPDGSATGDNFELTTSVGTLAPVLTIPTTYDLARNTSHQGTAGLNQNVRFIGSVKPTGETGYIAADGSFISAEDPRLKKAKEGEILVKQLIPQNATAKYQILNWDENVEGNRQVLAQYIASWIQVRRIRKELMLFNATITSTKAVQALVAAEDATAITFDKGSHLEEFEIANLTADSAWDLFNNATLNFGKIGLPSAKLDINKKFLHTEGVGDLDMLVYISKEFRQQLFKTPSLLASTPGLAIFKTAGIDMVNGIPVVTTNNLPEGVHMLVVSTGMSGTFAHELVGDGIGGNIVIDPNWSKAKRLDLWDEFVLGVVYDFLAYALIEKSTAPDAIIKAPKSKDTIDYIKSYLTQEGIDFSGVSKKDDLLALVK